MALELKRCSPLGRSRAGKAGRLRKGTTLSGTRKKNKKRNYNACLDNSKYKHIAADDFTMQMSTFPDQFV